MSRRAPSLRRLPEMVVATYRRNHLARNSGWVIIATGMNGLLGLGFWAEATHAFSTATVGSASAVLAAMTFASTMAMMGLGTTALQILPRADDETWSTAVEFGGGGRSNDRPGRGLGHGSGAPARVTASVVCESATGGDVRGLRHVGADGRDAARLCVHGRAPGPLHRHQGSDLRRSQGSPPEPAPAAWRAERDVAHRGVGRRVAHHVGKHARLAGAPTRATPPLWRNGSDTYIRKWFKILILHHMTSLGDVMIPSLMPVLVVARLSSVASAHFYIAWLLASFLLAVSAAVAGNLLAELSYNDEPMARTLRRAARLIAVLLLPPVFVLAIFGRSVLGIFGSTYAAHSYGILLLFVVVAVPDAVTNIYVSVLRVKGEPHKAAAMNFGMATVALVGAWFFMGVFGVAGAAWAWALAQAVGCGYVAVDAHATRGPLAPVSIGASRWVSDGPTAKRG